MGAERTARLVLQPVQRRPKRCLVLSLAVPIGIACEHVGLATIPPDGVIGSNCCGHQPKVLLTTCKRRYDKRKIYFRRENSALFSYYYKCQQHKINSQKTYNMLSSYIYTKKLLFLSKKKKSKNLVRLNNPHFSLCIIYIFIYVSGVCV